MSEFGRSKHIGAWEWPEKDEAQVATVPDHVGTDVCPCRPFIAMVFMSLSVFWMNRPIFTKGKPKHVAEVNYMVSGRMFCSIPLMLKIRKFGV